MFLKNYLRSDGPEQTLSVTVTRDDLESLTRDLVDEGIEAVHQLLERGAVRRRTSSAWPPVEWSECRESASDSTSCSA